MYSLCDMDVHSLLLISTEKGVHFGTIIFLAEKPVRRLILQVVLALKGQKI